jgi:hypothetical protein
MHNALKRQSLIPRYRKPMKNTKKKRPKAQAGRGEGNARSRASRNTLLNHGLVTVTHRMSVNMSYPTPKRQKHPPKNKERRVVVEDD